MTNVQDPVKIALQAYVEAAVDLAESVKRNIVHGGVIDNETVLKLNAFIISSNALEDLEIIEIDENESDSNLN